MKELFSNMIKGLFSIIVVLSIFPTIAEASGRTKTLACDTCNYNDALDLAQQYHVAPSCTASDTDIFLGQTTFTCPATSKDIIVSNPITQRSFKFTVRTEQLYNWAPAYDIVVEDATVTVAENNALHMFYDIDDDFRQAMAHNETVGFSAATSSFAIQSTKIFSTSSITASTNSDASCNSHASNVFANDPSFRNDIRKGFSDRITEAMGLQSWGEFTSERRTSGSLSIGMSTGITIDFSHVERKYFVTQTWPNGDKLVYQVNYNGETRNIVQKGRARTIRERFLNLSYSLRPGSSRIDNLPLTELTRGIIDLTNLPISVCLANQLSEVLDDVKVVGGAAGDGDLIDIVGAAASNGGTLIPPAGIWVNLAGCRIVESKGRICRDDTGDCIHVVARYVDC
ncbi:hypothetical protein KZZ04_11150 [Pseudoalteromonas sp. CR1]|uniref:hypothetical protein n=1 Tax=unclassified Pseudoalteromonas TaxID=194690 RepID=UPI000731A5E2|nr:MULTISPECIES: hypothetical protein [unclassified Pseudoalteromonas]KTD98395.1 hypothetical protein ATS71_11830 [Pseudoalteromonas sp. H71]MBW4966919.1 hypothetical protein [Pseudoalteromonas sp. CR1]|tara:strand:- start:5162 stop:6355 length:1194 start_codon:yes stop_codon:yes gene_type:complete